MANTPPVTTGFVENQAPVVLFENVAANLGDNNQVLTGAVMTVEHVADRSAETLNVGGTVIALVAGANGSLIGGGLYTVSLGGDTATVTLTGMALDSAGMAALIEGVTYQNTSDVPTPGQREIALTKVTDTDSNGTLTGISATITVEAVNDAPTFAPPTGGKVNISFGGMNDVATAVAIQPDGKIVAAGYHGTMQNQSFFSVARLNADGSLDTSFGDAGKIVFDSFLPSAQAYDVSILADGKILIAGSDYASQDMQVMRLNADGSLDTSFGNGGKALAGAPSAEEQGYKMLVQPDGKILMVGQTSLQYSSKPFTVARLNADGTPDTSFGTNGIEQIGHFNPQQGATSLALDATGNILVAGVWGSGPYSDIAVVRLRTDGSLDTSFAGSGVASIDLAGSYDKAEALLVLPDGKIVVSGYYNLPGGGQDLGVARLHADGTTDTTFGQNGKVTVSIGNGPDYLYNMVLQSDGKLVLVGIGGQDSNSDVALVRLNADGSLDESFGDGGTVLVSSKHLEGGYDVAILPDGKMVVVGTSSPEFPNEYLVLRLNADGSLDSTFNLQPGSNTLDGITSYTEGQSAVVLDASVGVFDAELAARDDYTGASITLARQGGADTQDVFSGSGDLAFSASSNSVTMSGITIGTYVQAAGSLTIEFNTNATQALVDKALSSIAYSNSSNTPPRSVNIQWTFDDGNSADAQGSGPAKQAIGTSTVNITGVNVAPTLTSIDTVADQVENTTVTLEFADLLALGNAMDADGSITSFTVTAVDKGMLKLGTAASNAQEWWPGNATIDASTKAFWTPPANLSGTQSAFKVVAVDNEGQRSTSSVQVNVELEAQPARPTLAHGTSLAAIQEDVPSADIEDYANNYLNMGDSIESLLDDSGYSDANGHEFRGIAIAGNAADPLTEGRWQYFNATDAQDRELWHDIGTVSPAQALLLGMDSYLRFVPVADFYGTPPGLIVHAVDTSGTRTFTTWDGTTENRHTADMRASDVTDISASGVTWNVSVSSVADAPVFTGIGADDNRTVTLPSDWLRLDTGAAATVTDVDKTPITAGTLRVEFASGGNSTDKFELDTLGGRVTMSGTGVLVDNALIGTIAEPGNVNALVMDLTNASMEQISLLLQRVNFKLDNEIASTRVVEIKLNDGEKESASQITLDAKPLPKVGVVLSPSNFKAGDTLTATFTLIETSNDFAADDVTIEGGTLSGFARDAVNPLTYTATITPTPGDNNVEVSVSVAAGRFENLNGAQNAASEAATATGDTQMPTFVTVAPTGAVATSTDTLIFRATFDEAVLNVDDADFRVVGTSNASVTNVSKIDGQTYDITVGGGNLADFNGEVGLALAAGTDITDAAANALNGLEPGSSASYTVDNTAPALISLVRGDVTQPAAGQALDIQVSLAETGSGIDPATVDLADIAVSGPGGTVLSVTNASYDATTGVATYTVSPPLDGWDLSIHAGLYTVALNANQVFDLAGLALAADPQAQTFKVIANATPVITSNGGGATATLNHAEGVLVVTTVTATDSDVDTLTYHIVDGADKALFTIDAASGTLAFSQPYRSDAPADTDTDGIYEVVVEARDAKGGVASQSISISVLSDIDRDGIPNVDDNDADGDGLGDDAESSVPDLTGGGYGDGNGDGTDDGMQLNVASVPTLGSGTADQLWATLAVGEGLQLTGVTNEAAPSGLPRNVKMPVGQFGFTIKGLEIGGKTQVDFYVDASQRVNTFYKFNTDTGRWTDISTASALVGSNKTKISFELTDGGAYDADGEANGVIVDPGGLAVEAPLITSNGGEVTAAVNVAENGTAVSTVVATLPPGASALTYTITGGADAARFTIDPATGKLIFASAPDFEAPADVAGTPGDNIYEVAVTATDGQGQSDTQTLSVTVTDVDEAVQPPKPPVIPPAEKWEDLPDNDGDGVPESVEKLVPGMVGGAAGDGNGDGIADIDQADVSSLPWAQTPDGTTRFVTLTNGSGLAQVGVKPMELAPEAIPKDLDLPLGLLAFQVDKVPDTGKVDFTVYIDSDIEVNGYWKQIDGEWVNIARDITREGGKTKISFTIEDGGRFDADGVKNGSIMDPGGPGWRNVVNPEDDADGDQFPDALESANGLTPGVKDNDVFASTKLFVMQLYRDFLYREAEPEGLAYWQARLDSGELTRADVAHTFLFASEFQDNAGAVARLYLGTYDRIPDNGGMHYWVDAVQDGQSLTQVAEQFAASAEFNGLYGSLDNQGFVSELYLNVQDRAGDAGGISYWVSQLEGGMSRGEVLVRFTQSDEYVEQSQEEVAVTLNYVGLLDRTPEQAGFDYWLDEIEAGRSELEVIGQFLGTDEYHDRFLPADAETTQVDIVGQTLSGASESDATV